VLKPVLERFLEKISVSKTNFYNNTPCWEWTSATDNFGYGQFWLNKNHVYSHRFAYELYQDKIPKGLEIDHLCRNHACCNPIHLEAVTHLENMKRSHPYQSTKTHCPKGHPYSGENLYRNPSNNYRHCIICTRVKLKEYNQSSKAKAQKKEYRLRPENIIKQAEYYQKRKLGWSSK